MSKQQSMYDELKDAPILQSLIGKNEVFQLPANFQAGFVNDLSDKMDRGLMADLAPLLDKIDRKNIYQVPPTYWETLKSSLLRISSKEIEQEVPLPKEDVFETPTDYFQQLKQEIRDRIDQDEKPHIPSKPLSRPLHSTVSSRSDNRPAWIKWGSFASIAAAVLIAFIWLISNPKATEAVSVSSLTNDEILDVIAASDIDEYALAEIIGEEELSQLSMLDEEIFEEEAIFNIIEEMDASELEETLLLDEFENLN